MATRTSAKSSPASEHASRGRTFQFQTNRILAALPADELQRIEPHLVETKLAFKRSLSHSGRPISHVCFPDSGVCSVVAVTRSGAAAEVGTIGNEGMTGVALAFGDASDPSECMVQVPGNGRLLPAAIFSQEMARNGTLRRFINHYAHALLVQVMQQAACNQLHSLEQRACKWMLMTHDRVFTDEFMLTHEFLSLMLGASRPSVTVAAHQLQADGLIKYRHGHVTIIDRARLKASSCECYGIVAAYFDQFLQRLSTEHARPTTLSSS